jgi:2-polyprenyl-3-methyl-5-hydroxy-6-metoxy-1,4-benzoquinol methylase
MSAVSGNSAFGNYWERIRLRDQAMAIPAPCVTWQRMESFNEAERVIWERVKGVSRILDFGCGDQSLRKKVLAAGYVGRYETYDASREFPTTWDDPDHIEGPFGAVICLEVIEHLPLPDGRALRERLVSWLEPGGWLILSTPNPACVVSPFSRDETHVHLYPLHDLLTWSLSIGLVVEARRIKLLPDRLTLKTRTQLVTQRLLCYLLGGDRADGLMILARRPA